MHCKQPPHHTAYRRTVRVPKQSTTQKARFPRSSFSAPSFLFFFFFFLTQLDPHEMGAFPFILLYNVTVHH